MKKTCYITTPIFYPSGKLHLGNLYTVALAKTIANYKKANGYNVIFVTGMDEHGQKIKAVASKSDQTTQDYVDTQAAKAQKLWKDFGLSPDHFVRTSDVNHKEIIKKCFKFLEDNNFIYKDNYDGLYSTSDEEFIPQNKARFENEKWLHPESGHELIEIKEETYFLKLSNFNNWIKNYLEKQNDLVIPQKAKNEVINSFLKTGLKDLALTRLSNDWGIKHPTDSKHTIYVWFDALLSYISILNYGQKDSKLFDRYWKNGTEIVHLIGKEIRRFHLIYWPITLKMLNLRQPTKILSHGWIKNDQAKMSKSRNNTLDPLFFSEKIGHEAVNFFLVTYLSHYEDTNLKPEMIFGFYNAQLSNNFGNLVSRVFKLIQKNFSKPLKFTMPEDGDSLTFIKTIQKLTKNFVELMNNYELNKAFQASLKLSQEINVFIEKKTPWFLARDKNMKELENVLNLALNGIYNVGLMLGFAMPQKMNLLLDSLGIEKYDFSLASDFNKFNKVMIKEVTPLFERYKP